MTFTVYLLYSETNEGYYIGYTSNIAKRLTEHNTGLTRSTQGKGPWKIVYTEEYTEKSEALKREIFLKKQKNREFYKKLIGSANNKYTEI